MSNKVVDNKEKVGPKGFTEKQKSIICCVLIILAALALLWFSMLGNNKSTKVNEPVVKTALEKGGFEYSEEEVEEIVKAFKNYIDRDINKAYLDEDNNLIVNKDSEGFFIISLVRNDDGKLVIVPYYNME